ncbi:MAG TPA: cytochrome P450 [Flavobacterium sp.]|jgi:fatty-acid peroxygenase
MDTKIAAVEVINLVRPIVAITRYIIFSAHALHEHPEYRQKLRNNDSLYELFIHEVRRFYPFFPFTSAKVRKTFDWNGVNFPKGSMVLLDIYGTNHDEKTWTDPGKFIAERFSDWNGSPYNFIPQGGGSHNLNHRCPGEWITIKLSKIALRFLVKKMDYTVPEQDLRIDLGRIPAIPESRFRIAMVKKR